jgi:hypothetical protein
MLKFIIALLVLLAICIVVGIVRKLRGGTFFPAPYKVDGEDEPQSLKEMAEQKKPPKKI